MAEDRNRAADDERSVLEDELDSERTNSTSGEVRDSRHRESAPRSSSASERTNRARGDRDELS
jgi:hypothetical protein